MVLTDRRNKKIGRFSTGTKKSFEKDLILKLHFKEAIYDTPVNRGEAPMTASGGNLIGAEVIRNKRSVRWTVAPIEDAEGRSRLDDPHPAGFTSYLFPAECIDILFLHIPISIFTRDRRLPGRRFSYDKKHKTAGSS